ncbi:MAG: acylphosphatase [Verrucomicrobia bacterium]|nr:MAG: acylphosphatase [Verrucomicrobiota bacterium]
MSEPPPVFHLTAHFSGRVQGVGFRYTVYQVAKEFEVSGYVRNLADGRVCLEAEGRQSEVESFLETVRDRMDGLIREVEDTTDTRSAFFSGFSIR